MSATAARLSVTMLCVVAALAAAPQARAQEGDPPQTAPPTTLPFEPTVPSAPPERPTYPDRQPQVQAPPPGDPLCHEIGPIIRAGVVASRFASLSPSTAQGYSIGRFEAGEALQALGASYCTVVIPAATPETAGSPFNQVTCRLASDQGDAAYLEDLRKRRDTLAERIAKCPSVSQWSGTRPPEETLDEADTVEDYLFTHPDVSVEMIVRAEHHKKAGEWPLDYIRTLSLVFRTPNPDRPAPETEEAEPPAGFN